MIYVSMYMYLNFSILQTFFKFKGHPFEVNRFCCLVYDDCKHNCVKQEINISTYLSAIYNRFEM